jgi:hypothetical protein
MPITIDGTNGITQAGEFNSDSSFGFKNRIINGAMVISQYNGTSSVTPTDSSFALDRFKCRLSQTSKYTVQQNAGSVTPPVGFSNYLGVTSSSAYSIVASDFFELEQSIEGFNTADLGWGTANAKTITLSFQVYSSLTGTFGGAIQNSARNRSYPFTYSIPTANTWTTISVTIAGDTSGTWIGATNGIGLTLAFSLGTGSTYSTTAGAWASGIYWSATGATSVVGTSGATFYITGVQLEVGTVATSFDFRSIGTEFALCQRYYWKIARGAGEPYGQTGYNIAGNAVWSQFGLPVTMRATPTVTIYGTWAVANTGQPTIRGASSTNFIVQIIPSATGIATAYPDSSDDLIDASIEL